MQHILGHIDCKWLCAIAKKYTSVTITQADIISGEGLDHLHFKISVVIVDHSYLFPFKSQVISFGDLLFCEGSSYRVGRQVIANGRLAFRLQKSTKVFVDKTR